MPSSNPLKMNIKLLTYPSKYLCVLTWECRCKDNLNLSRKDNTKSPRFFYLQTHNSLTHISDDKMKLNNFSNAPSLDADERMLM